MIKLIYIHGEFGQVARPDGKRYRKTDSDYSGFEIYSNKKEAIRIAQNYVKKHPLNCCHLVDEDDNCEEIYGEEQQYFVALEERKKERAQKSEKLQTKRRQESLYISYIV